MLLKKLLVALLLLAPITVRAEDKSPGSPSAPAETLAKLKFGMILPLSGDFSAIGTDLKNGINLAMKESSIQELIELVYGDSKADPMSAVNEFKKMVDSDHIAGVFAFRGPIGMALNPISKRSEVPLLGGVGNREFALNNKYAFQMWVPADIEGKFFAEQIAKRGHKTLAVVTLEDDWTSTVSKFAIEKFKSDGGSVVLAQDLSPKEQDFRSLVAQIKDKNPAAIMLNISIAQIGLFLRQLNEQAVNKAIFSNFWVNKKDALQAAGKAAEGVIYSEMSTAALPQFSQGIEAATGGKPSGATLSGYVATKLVLQTLAADNGIKNANQLYTGLLAQTELVLPDKKLAITDRIVDFPLGMNVIKDGKGVPVD